MADIRMIYVPYKGSPQAITGLLGGEVALLFATMPPAMPMVAAGKLRALGVTTPQRTGAAPEVPNVYGKVGALPVTNTPEEFAAHVQSEMVKLGRLVQLSGARVD